MVGLLLMMSQPYANYLHHGGFVIEAVLALSKLPSVRWVCHGGRSSPMPITFSTVALSWRPFQPFTNYLQHGGFVTDDVPASLEDWGLGAYSAVVVQWEVVAEILPAILQVLPLLGSRHWRR